MASGGAGAAPGPGECEPALPSPRAQLLSVISDLWLADALGAAARLRVADALEAAPLPLPELAAKVEADPPSLLRLMRALVSVGVFSETSDNPPAYSLTPMSTFLTTSHPASARPTVLLTSSPHVATAMANLAHAVKTGSTAFELLYGSPFYDFLRQDQGKELSDVFNAAMSSVSRADSQAILASYDFSGVRRLVDVAGGKGQLLRSILEAHPKMQGVLFDLPDVVDGTPGDMVAAGLGDRFEAVGGSFLEAPQRTGLVDACIIKNSFWNWGDEGASKLLNFCHGSLEDGGKLLVYEGIVPEGSGPHFSKLFDVHMMALIPGAKTRTAKEHEVLLNAAGFQLERIIPTKGPSSIIQAVKTQADALPDSAPPPAAAADEEKVLVQQRGAGTAPPPAPPRAQLMSFTGKAWAADAVCAAAVLKIADFLQDAPLSADSLALKVGAEPLCLFRLLRALASVGMLTQTTDSQPKFGLTPVSALLSTTHPKSMHAIVVLMVNTHWVTPMAHLHFSVKTGTSAFQKIYGADVFTYLAQHHDLAEAFGSGMTAMSLADADAILGARDFSAVRCLMDVGGGKGQLLRRILGAYPKLHGVLLDLPSVVAGVAESFAAEGLGDRVEVVGGSFLEAPQRLGFVDVCVVKNLCWDFGDEGVRALLSFCHASLEQVGALLIYEGVAPEGDGRDFSKCIDLLFLATLSGAKVRTVKEHDALLSEAGFSMEKFVSFEDGYAMIVAKKK